MQISSAEHSNHSMRLSAFPWQERPFTEPLNATADDVIGKGLTIPELIKRYYPTALPVGFEGRFGFLDRDNKIREYHPGKEDPFVFKSNQSVALFRDEALALLKLLTDAWRTLGWPVIFDKDRKVDVPDSHAVWQALDPKHPQHAQLLKDWQALQFIIGNADIMKKASVVRGINPGWWCASYRGKKSESKEFFKLSIAAHKLAFSRLTRSPKYRDLVAQQWDAAGDPLDTNPGYPFFESRIDAEGRPVSRIQTVELFRKLQGVGSDWNKVLADVDARAGKYGMDGYPFCIAPLRRLSAGYKWNHQFFITPSGMRTAFDQRGENSQRVAWMVPYVYNLLLTPLHVHMKAIRLMMPGLYHDGSTRLRRTALLQRQRKKRELFMAEADYSNYDRFVPVDIIEEIVNGFAELVDGSTQYWKDATMYLHKEASLIWPDYSSASDGNGWLFKPGTLGLMSGVKWTSEAGTFVNSVINGECLARTFNWTVDQLVDYLCMYENAPVGSKFEYYYVQSDDTQLIQTSPAKLKQQGDWFLEAVKAAGLKGSLELADRFLMRQMDGGDDRPVPSRVWQNTLSNETAPDSELVFLAGLAARTDGLLGWKTVDPFATGKHQAISGVERLFTERMLSSLKTFISKSALPSRRGLSMIDSLLSESLPIPERLSDAEFLRRVAPVEGINGSALDLLRHDVTRMLAQVERAAQLKLSSKNKEFAWLYGLFKDRHVPSSSLLLAQLTALDSGLSAELEKMANMEHKFFLYAIDTIGVRFVNTK